MTSPPTLDGRTVLVTRPSRRGDELHAALQRLGVTSILAPAIRVETASEGVDAITGRIALDDCDEVIFTSRYGVLGLLGDRRPDADGMIDIGGTGRATLPPAIAVGPSTARVAKQRGFDIELDVPFGGAAALVDARLETGGVAGRRFLWPRGDLAEVSSLDPLVKTGAEIEDVVVYHTHDAYAEGGAPSRKVFEALDAVVVGSPSAVTNLTQALDDDLRGRAFAEWEVIAIGETTGQSALEAGYRRVGTAGVPGNVGIIKALEGAFARRS